MKLDTPELSTLSGVGLYLYDFDSLYELTRLALDTNYKEFEFSRFALYRNHRRLRSIDKLHIQDLSFKSPLEVVSSITAYASAGAAILATIWLLIQIIEKLYNLQLNHEKLQLEIEKLKKTIYQDDEINDNNDNYEILEDRNAIEFVEVLERRLSQSGYKIIDLDLSIDISTSSIE